MGNGYDSHFETAKSETASFCDTSTVKLYATPRQHHAETLSSELLRESETLSYYEILQDPDTARSSLSTRPCELGGA